MTLSTQVVLFGLLAQVAGAVVLALLLQRYWRFHRRPYLRTWALGWWSLALGQAGATTGLWLHGSVAASHPLRLLAAALAATGAYLQAAWLLIGTYEVSSGRSFTRRRSLPILGPLVALGVVSAFAYAFEPAAGEQRVLLRVAVRALALALSFLVAGIVLWRVRGRSRDLGPRFVSATFVAVGTENLLTFVVVVLPGADVYSLALVFLDLLCMGIMGLATIVWLLEEEHHRLADASRQIEQLAYYDLVTGLPNRKSFLDRLRHFIERNQRSGEAAAILFLDLDHFKSINDTHGHDVGDLLLSAVGERLRRAVREGDLVGRLGGDEFTLLLPGVRTAEDAGEIATALLEKLAQPFRVEDHVLYAGASLGICIYPQHGDDPAVLLRHADAAMYVAKEAGRGRWAIHSSEINARSRRRFELETSLRAGIAAEQLLLHYQPIVAAGSGDIVGAEALVRWHHPEQGMLSPLEFLPLAESTGLSEAISRWVLETGCRQLADWRNRLGSDLRLSINLTARAFEDPQLGEKVAGVLAASELPPGALELEITESMALMHGGSHLATLRALRESGVHVAVDDFGTGYSSLSYLRELPIDALKLDSSFIRLLGRRPADSKIVGAVIALAHGLGIGVVAEGVEEEEQMAVLEMLGCDRMQGYLFSAPLDTAEFEAVITASGPFRTVRAPNRDRSAKS
ncbi:MAG: EAL domain-containing protein [Thermoanaerobaculia bacterium]